MSQLSGARGHRTANRAVSTQEFAGSLQELPGAGRVSPGSGVEHVADIGSFLPRQVAGQYQRHAGRKRLGDRSRARLAHRQVRRPHQVGHVLDEAEDHGGRLQADAEQPAPKPLVAAADRDHLPGMGLFRQPENLVPEAARPLAASGHQHCRAVCVQAEPAAHRALLPWQGRPEANVDGQTELLQAVRPHPPLQRRPARRLRRHHDQVGAAADPTTMHVDQVGHNGHQRSPAAVTPQDGRGDVVEQWVDREHDVRIGQPQLLTQDATQLVAEGGTQRREGWRRVGGVEDRTPSWRRALDDGGVERGDPAGDGGALADQRVEPDNKGARLDGSQRIVECPGRRVVAPTEV
jgi:hypothetical protein